MNELVFLNPTQFFLLEYVVNSDSPVVLKTMAKDKAEYYRLYRASKTLEKLGYLEIRKINGLIQLTPTKKGTKVYLINRKAKFKIENPPRRISPERLEAIEYIRKHNLQILDDSDFSQINDSFEFYLRRVGSKRIVLYNPDPYNPLEFLIMKYKTRFTDRGRISKIIRTYEAVIQKSLENYNVGVFLTLTTDPKRFNNLIQAYKFSLVAWNRFRYYINKLKKKWSYVLVHEFTKSGLLHLHVLIFGIERIADIREISRIWSKIGMGRIVYIYKIIKRGNSWVWAKGKPKDTNTTTADSYLKKYLSKVLSSIRQVSNDNIDVLSLKNLALYWVSNKRFYTYSRDLGEKEDIKKYVIGEWIFFGSYDVTAIPLVVLLGSWIDYG